MYSNKLKKVVFAFLLFTSFYSYSQQRLFRNNISVQDSSVVFNEKIWFDLSFGPSLTVNPDNENDYFFWGPTLGATFIRKNYRLFKIKTSLHRGVNILSNFPQQTVEVGGLIGKISTSYTREFSVEFYCGIAAMAGVKRKSVLSKSDAGANGSDFILGIDYEKQEFITVGIPFECKLQWRVLGLGIDGNINYYLPYIGLKWYLKFGDTYRK